MLFDSENWSVLLDYVFTPNEENKRIADCIISINNYSLEWKYNRVTEMDSTPKSNLIKIEDMIKKGYNNNDVKIDKISAKIEPGHWIYINFQLIFPYEIEKFNREYKILKR
jgi:hypothetical protein